VLTPAEEDEEAVSEASDDLPSSPGSGSGKPSPSPSLGLFLLAAEERGGSLRSSRRSAVEVSLRWWRRGWLRAGSERPFVGLLSR
jgi:hypothetical protein